MVKLGNLFLILGVCLGTVGAAGFTDPPEPESWVLFSLGLVGVVVGGTMLRRSTRPSTSGSEHTAAAIGDLVHRVESIAREVGNIDQAKDQMSAEEFCARLEGLSTGEYFDLGSRSDEFQQQLGFGSFSKVWSGIAVCERLLARAWSMATDGHLDQAREEIPMARAEIEASLQAAESL
jgi:hypothetical protein